MSLPRMRWAMRVGGWFTTVLGPTRHPRGVQARVGVAVIAILLVLLGAGAGLARVTGRGDALTFPPPGTPADEPAGPAGVPPPSPTGSATTEALPGVASETAAPSPPEPSAPADPTPTLTPGPTPTPPGSSATSGPDIPDADLVDQITMFGGGADSGWCDLTNQPLATQPTVLSLVSERGDIVNEARVAENYMVCFEGFDNGDVIGVEVVGPDGIWKEELIVDGEQASAQYRWVATAREALGQYRLTVTTPTLQFSDEWNLVRRETPAFLVVDDVGFSGSHPRPQAILIAAAGYAPSSTVRLHVYYAEPEDDIGTYRETLEVDLDEHGQGVFFVDSTQETHPPGCYRVEEFPVEAVEFGPVANGRVFCLS